MKVELDTCALVALGIQLGRDLRGEIAMHRIWRRNGRQEPRPRMFTMRTICNAWRSLEDVDRSTFSRMVRLGLRSRGGAL